MAIPLTVVIPCYRGADAIERALVSVRAQTLQASEIVIVDDASDDGTADTLQRIAKDRTDVRMLSHELNRGPASARNTGWDAASGKYVAFLDSDDSWLPRKLEMQVRFMEANPDVAACGHLHVVAEGGIRDLTVPESPAVTQVGFGDLLWRNRFITSSAMVRRDLPFRFPDGQRYMEDHRLWLEMARAGQRIARIEAPLAAHHKPDFGAGGLSGDLQAMEKAELGNYRALRRAGAIGTLMLAVLTAWSLAKYARRGAIVALRRLSG
jgi:glycosyltransferase involved in cell wall biosynthesis